MTYDLAYETESTKDMKGFSVFRISYAVPLMKEA